MPRNCGFCGESFGHQDSCPRSILNRNKCSITDVKEKVKRIQKYIRESLGINDEKKVLLENEFTELEKMLNQGIYSS